MSIDFIRNRLVNVWRTQRKQEFENEKFLLTVERKETRKVSQNYKIKILAKNGVRNHYLPLTRLALSPTSLCNHFDNNINFIGKLDPY